MVMAEFYTHDKLQELWKRISHLHLTYLDTEDSPQKIEQRNKLEACIRDYLCLAPHNRKFCCSETAEVLHQSASSKKDFSGYKAALGWNAVSMYAGNLLSQPWRKEYRQIKTYSGFYKHQIEANLAGAEAMFEAMGYKYIGNGILVLEGPVCPDRVTNVSQDSIVAFVECQILKTIWEEVCGNFKVSWLEVLEFRENHLSSPEQSIRMLNYRFQERRYQEQQNRTFPQGTDTYSTIPRYGTTSNNHPIQSHAITHAPPITGMHSFPPTTSHAQMNQSQAMGDLAHAHGSTNAHQIGLSHSHLNHSLANQHIGMSNPHQIDINHSHLHSNQELSHTNHIMSNPHHPELSHAHGLPNPHQVDLGHAHMSHMSHGHMQPQFMPVPQPCQAQCVYGNPYYNYSTYAPVVPSFPRYGGVPYNIGPPKACNGFCYPNGCVPAPTYAYPVPTGQLIELDASHNGTYDTTDSLVKAMRQQDYLESHKQLAKSTNLDSLTLSKSKEDGAGTFESWDFVYRNLESQGYSKDLGERGDVLQETRRKNTREKKTKPSIELEDAFNTLNLNAGSNHNGKVAEGIKRFSNEPNKFKSEPEGSKVPQSTSYDNITQETYKPKASNGVNKTKTLPRERVAILSPDKQNHTLDTKKLRKDIDKAKPKKGGWNCKACTYLNSPGVEICVMCGKSKVSVDLMMAVGGSQCPVCTLVNPREVTTCQACEASLENSPTYI